MPILRIFPPDFDSYGQIEYNMTGVSFIRPEHIKHSNLPSGLYTFVQSICPNDKTEVKTCYLHVCPERCKLSKLACEDDNEKITDLWFQLEVAQSMVEECPEKACQLFEEIKKEISKLENDCNIC